jgi:hypothetical protein
MLWPRRIPSRPPLLQRILSLLVISFYFLLISFLITPQLLYVRVRGRGCKGGRIGWSHYFPMVGHTKLISVGHTILSISMPASPLSPAISCPIEPILPEWILGQYFLLGVLSFVYYLLCYLCIISGDGYGRFHLYLFSFDIETLNKYFHRLIVKP